MRQDVMVAQIPQPLLPSTGDRGCATADGPRLADAALAAWDAFIAVASTADLDRRSRNADLTGAQSLLAFGDWPENRSLDQILDDARSGRTGTVDQALDARLVLANHASATAAEALAAVERSRDHLAEWIDSDGPDREGLLATRSLLGTLPVLTLIHAAAFQIAVVGRDLEACGAAADPDLVDTGLSALIDTTGALAARQGATASITVRTPEGFLGVGALPGAWRTADLTGHEGPLGPGIIAKAGTVLDIASGRVSVPSLYASGDVAVTDLPGLLALAPIIEGVPGIPASAALARAARVMNGIGGVLGSLGGLFRR